MYKLIHQSRAAAYNAAFIARYHKTTTFTRPIHNVNLVGLHNKLNQPAPQTLRLHGLKLHGPATKTAAANQVKQKVDAAFYKTTLQTIKLVGLHNTLHQPPEETISMRSLCLHDHARYLQPINNDILETIVEMGPQSTPNPQIQTKEKTIKSSKIPVPSTKIHIRNTASASEPSVETPLLSKVTFARCITALGDAVESMMWFKMGHPKNDLQLPQDADTTSPAETKNNELH